MTTFREALAAMKLGLSAGVSKQSHLSCLSSLVFGSLSVREYVHLLASLSLVSVHSD